MREKVNRARRYPIDIVLSYRPVGETRWRQGTTENFAYSGLLLRSQESLKVGTQIELKLRLPAFIVGKSPAWVISEGRIARLQAPSSSEGDFFYAMTISNYEIARRPRAVGLGARRNRGRKVKR
jgi:hypothetical protein